MSFLQKVKEITGLKFFLTVIVAITAYYQFKAFFITTALFHSAEELYANFLVIVLNIISEGYKSDLSQWAITNNEYVFYFKRILETKYFLLSAIILFLFPREIIKTFRIYALAIGSFVTLTICKVLIERYLPTDIMSFLSDLIVSLQYLILLKLLTFKMSLYRSTSLLYRKWDEKIRNTFVFSLNTLLTVIAFVRALTGLFDWFLVAKWNLIVVYLTEIILFFSNAILWLTGYAEAYSWEKYILLKNYWLFLDSNCLGVGLMVVFTLLIGSIRSNLANKLIYIVGGLLFIIMMNSIRIVIILLYIYENQIPAPLIKDYHDLSNNIFYVVVFFVILLYINWFQFINLRGTKKTQ